MGLFGWSWRGLSEQQQWEESRGAGFGVILGVALCLSLVTGNQSYNHMI